MLYCLDSYSILTFALTNICTLSCTKDDQSIGKNNYAN